MAKAEADKSKADAAQVAEAEAKVKAKTKADALADSTPQKTPSAERSTTTPPSVRVHNKMNHQIMILFSTVYPLGFSRTKRVAKTCCYIYIYIYLYCCNRIETSLN